MTAAIIGAAPLLAMRRAGQKPAGLVFLNAFPWEPKRCRDWHLWQDSLASPELWVKPGTHPLLLDLGCLVGLHVVVHAETWSEWLADLWDAVLEIPPASAILVTHDDDLAVIWTLQHGERSVGEPLLLAA